MMAARSSFEDCHSGSSAWSSSDRRFSPTRMPTNALRTLFVTDQPGNALSALKPGA